MFPVTVSVKDHPHACGDKQTLCYHIQTLPGSSPRVWGQVKVFGTKYCCSRIIPTRVGTSPYQISYRKTPRDHPHACGDKRKTLAQQYEAQGSSPRVWGQAAPANIIQRGGRIIPTRVGTRVCYLGFVCLCQDHPHAYGDKQLSLTLSVMLRGSSPRVWGQVRAINSPLDIERIIPTRMGTSKRRSNSSC